MAQKLKNYGSPIDVLRKNFVLNLIIDENKNI